MDIGYFTWRVRAEKAWRHGALAALFIVAFCGGASRAGATSLDPSILPKVRASTFEVIIPKPTSDPLSYDKPLPLDLLPYQFRNDKYFSIGSAFALDNNRYVTAAHVLNQGIGSMLGEPALRDSNGHVYAIGKIYKYSSQQDFAVFSLKQSPPEAALGIEPSPSLNRPVYAVGNALGTGVVIRDGLYTSKTPEDLAGRWEWLRFSAAASAGNSGGPLLNEAGKVIGVVVMKSPNENLNYALPIDLVLKAPDDLAVLDTRATYALDIFDTTRWSDLKQSVSLPKTFSELERAYLQHMNAYSDGQLRTLLEHEKENLFPSGKGSNWILHNQDIYVYEHLYPMLMVRRTNGIWDTGIPANRHVDALPDNGYVERGSTMFDLLQFHLRKPDSVRAEQLWHDPKLYADLLLRAQPMTRNVGSSAVKITSLGEPREDFIFDDDYRRRWQVRVWPLAYADMQLVLFCLPVPDGYVSIGRLVHSGTDEHVAISDLKVLTRFIYLSYDGTLAQWRDYLAEKDLLPALFSFTHVDFGYGKNFSYRSRRLDFSYTPELLQINENSKLRLSFSYFNEGGQWTWDVAALTAKKRQDASEMLQVVRLAEPTPDLDSAFQNVWQKKLHREHPNDGTVFHADDTSMIDAVVDPASDSPTTPFLYTVFYRTTGMQSQETMKPKLDLLLRGTKVLEH